MRVVCLVPSWTETLLEAGVNVVGRSRYCVHPAGLVADVPAVGGTKDVRWEKVRELEPDVLLLDEEENTRRMAAESPVPWLATQVTSVGDVECELRRLHERLGAEGLLEYAERWREAIANLSAEARAPDWLKLPGVVRWWRRPGPAVRQFVYFVWKDPWTAVGAKTFIASVFSLLGFGDRMCRLPERYTRVRLEDFDATTTLLLFSTEPYDFAACEPLVKQLPFASALVDGECYGWFGLRCLRFLEATAVHI